MRHQVILLPLRHIMYRYIIFSEEIIHMNLAVLLTDWHNKLLFLRWNALYEFKPLQILSVWLTTLVLRKKFFLFLCLNRTRQCKNKFTLFGAACTYGDLTLLMSSTAAKSSTHALILAMPVKRKIGIKALGYSTNVWKLF